MNLPNLRIALFCPSARVFGLQTAYPAASGSNPDAAGSVVRRRGSNPRPAGSPLRRRVANPAAAGAIPDEMGWLPERNGMRPTPRGMAPRSGGIHPTPQTCQPAACGMKPAGRGIEPEEGSADTLVRINHLADMSVRAPLCFALPGTENREPRTEPA